ncbi:MAG: group 1 truncated hemoglobin [Phycisphaerae bacterium]
MTRTGWKQAWLLSVMAGLMVAGCGDKAWFSWKKKSLYDRLGGEKAIRAVSHDFIDRAAKDPKVNFTRHGTAKEWHPNAQQLAHLEDMVVQLVCMVTGGPQKYTGRDIKELHRGMKISQAEFDAMAGDLAASLDQFHVPKAEKDELLAIIAGTAKDVVEM